MRRSELLDATLEHHFRPGPNQSQARYDRAKSAIELYFKPGLGHIRLCDLTKRHVEQLVAAMRRVNRDEDEPTEMLRRLLAVRATWRGIKRLSDRPLSDATIKRNLVVLHAALNTDDYEPSYRSTLLRG